MKVSTLEKVVKTFNLKLVQDVKIGGYNILALNTKHRILGLLFTEDTFQIYEFIGDDVNGKFKRLFCSATNRVQSIHDVKCILEYILNSDEFDQVIKKYKKNA